MTPSISEKPEVKRTEAEATGQSAKEKKSGAEEDEDGSGDVEFSVCYGMRF